MQPAQSFPVDGIFVVNPVQLIGQVNNQVRLLYESAVLFHISSSQLIEFMWIAKNSPVTDVKNIYANFWLWLNV